MPPGPWISRTSVSAPGSNSVSITARSRARPTKRRSDSAATRAPSVGAATCDGGSLTLRSEDVLGQPPFRKECNKKGSDDPHKWVERLGLADRDHRDHVAEHAETDARGDREGERNARDCEERRDGVLGRAPVDLRD